MSDQRDDSDDALLAQLRKAFDVNVPVPPSMVDMIMTGYDITNLEAHLAELVEDTPLAERAGVRAGSESDSRLISFEFGAVRFEFELRQEAPQIIGHVDGAGGGVLHLEQVESSESLILDESGAFEFSTQSSAPFRLRYDPQAGTAIATEWILP